MPPAAIPADMMYRHSFATSMDHDYGHIPELRRAERRRAVRTTPAIKSEPTTTSSTRCQKKSKWSEPTLRLLLPLVKTVPSAPVYEGKSSIITSLPTIVPFIYPQIQGTTGLNHETQRPLPHYPACNSRKVRWSVLTDFLILIREGIRQRPLTQLILFFLGN